MPGRFTPSHIPRHGLTLVLGHAQDSLHLLVIFGSFCPPPRMASAAPVGHLRLQSLQPLPYLHPLTEGHSDGGGQEVSKQLRPDKGDRHWGTAPLPPSRPDPPHRALAVSAGQHQYQQCPGGAGPVLPCPAAPGRPSHHRRSPGLGVLPASGRNHGPKAQANVWAHGPRVHGWDLVRFHTLLMRVTVYTNSSGSAPFFSSRMDTKLAQGRVPAAWERRQSWGGSGGGEG